ncbi:ATP-dependent endonuclease [Asaia bogorensis]|uniref:ATP-dependent nuclease n=1 Tax=Asaia bogorensis TaxID=91915 RepID=UPI000EFC24E2|nr:AAA family ATPase [Asaia bogorensis]
MIIINIGANNFRTFSKFSLDIPHNYVAISGKNNAGKTAILRIIQHFLTDDANSSFSPFNSEISFTRDCTQWVAAEAEDMSISLTIEIDHHQDSEVFFVVKTFSSIDEDIKKIRISMSQKYNKGGGSQISCIVNEKEIEGQKASEVLKKIRSASNMVVHNSTNPERNIFYAGGGSFTEIIEAHFSPDDQQKIAEAQKGLQAKVRRAARQHKEDLEGLLGKLKDRFKVELTTIDRERNSRFPLEVKLTDRDVEIPLNDWGAGTQNRTRVLMSVLEAARIRSSTRDEDRSSPIFLVEEPESFLHPSAQSEFGQVLNSLSQELDIQIIATTHSPYMLNQTCPSANILLERKLARGVPRETFVRDTEGDGWMMPFAEILGIIPHEFSNWLPLFSSVKPKVILVEGEIDKEYFEFFRANYPKICKIPADVEILPYGGKDALKNTPILQFMLNKFGRVFITFDLDARDDVIPALDRIGLVQNEDYLSIGVAGPGTGAIEGLLPNTLKRKVYSENVDLVTQLQGDTKSRNSAKSSLKRKMLDEFKVNTYEEKELQPFKTVFSVIDRKISS